MKTEGVLDQKRNIKYAETIKEQRRLSKGGGPEGSTVNQNVEIGKTTNRYTTQVKLIL